MEKPGITYRKPYPFRQNERFNGYFAQVCGRCGIVTLERQKGPDFFLCWLCHFNVKNSTIPKPKKPKQTRLKVSPDLTLKRYEVAKLLSEGQPINSIAQSLEVKPNTVSVRLTFLKKKLGIKTNEEVISWFKENYGGNNDHD